jgi:hypothetical protein
MCTCAYVMLVVQNFKNLIRRVTSLVQFSYNNVLHVYQLECFQIGNLFCFYFVYW